MNNENFWYDLIVTARDNGEIENGLTIPYILGAQKIIDKDFIIDDNSIYDLLLEIISSETELKAVLQHCGSISQYVIGLNNAEFCKRNFKNELSFKNEKGEDSLYLTLNANLLGETIEEISNNLSAEYEVNLKDENFSWSPVSMTWRKFNRMEIEAIEIVLNK